MNPAIRVRLTVLLAFLFLCFSAQAQVPRMNDAAAKDAIHRIMQHSGLLPNFTVREDLSIPTAQAYIKGKQRVIAYNPVFISRIMDSTGTDLAAVSILAHEIAHHLLGHTLDPNAVYPGDELACDKYSGFILQRMHVSSDDAIAAIRVAGNVHGTRTHPPQHAREEAIVQGWHEALFLSLDQDMEPFKVDKVFQFVVHFAGDSNTYFVDSKNNLVWFDNYAEPISFGTCKPLAEGEHTHTITWHHATFKVDSNLKVWRLTSTGMRMQVGEMEPFLVERH